MEFTQLTKRDYSKILKYYKTDIPKNKKTRKQKAEKILADKLCKCIKKVKKPKENESRATAICRKSVISRKKLTSFGFTCKKKPTLRNKKGKTYKLLKKTD
tara:strand:- start:914 stop:1216 length:303 start_codon:yes stop_codon:yes gene_type:complete